jgi:hypothetical protein
MVKYHSRLLVTGCACVSRVLFYLHRAHLERELRSLPHRPAGGIDNRLLPAAHLLFAFCFLLSAHCLLPTILLTCCTIPARRIRRYQT